MTRPPPFWEYWRTAANPALAAPREGRLDVSPRRCPCHPRTLRNPNNQGFVRAVNQAASEARGEYLLLLNNDAELLPGALDCAVETLARNPDIGAVGGPILARDGSLQEAGSMIFSGGTCVG